MTDHDANHNKNDFTFISSILDLNRDDRPHVSVNILGTQVRGLLDSGASCTILGKGSDEIIRTCRLKTTDSKFTIKTADGSLHTINTSCDVPYEIGGV